MPNERQVWKFLLNRVHRKVCNMIFESREKSQSRYFYGPRTCCGYKTFSQRGCLLWAHRLHLCKAPTPRHQVSGSRKEELGCHEDLSWVEGVRQEVTVREDSGESSVWREAGEGICYLWVREGN